MIRSCDVPRGLPFESLIDWPGIRFPGLPSTPGKTVGSLVQTPRVIVPIRHNSLYLSYPVALREDQERADRFSADTDV